jgi:hypothetical protein
MLADKRYCYQLTISDFASRYLLVRYPRLGNLSDHLGSSGRRDTRHLDVVQQAQDCEANRHCELRVERAGSHGCRVRTHDDVLTYSDGVITIDARAGVPVF